MKSAYRKLLTRGLSALLAALMILGLLAGSVTKADDSSLEEEDKIKTYTLGYGARDFHEYDLIEGWHQKAECELHFFYSDGYFTRETSLYNEHLATCSLNMAVAAFANVYESTTYETQAKDIVSLLKDIGCETVYVNDGFKQKMTKDTVGACYGLKNIQLYNDSNKLEDYVLIPIVLRGGGYEAEWASNVTLNSTGEAAGFSHGADIVMANVDTFISSYGLDPMVKSGHAIFWIMGYSRGGAISNLTAKRLIDKYTTKYGSKVYAYTFEAPQGGLDSTNGNMDSYSGIHNIINESDIVPYVAPSSMGFKRYGVDHYVPGSTTLEGSYKESVSGAKYDNDRNIKITTRRDNDYLTVSEENGRYVGIRERMRKELKLVDPTFEFDDAFQLYEMILFTTDKSKQAKSFPIKNSGNISLGDFEQGLLDQFCKWCGPSRDYYATHNISLDFTEFTNFQEGLSTILELFMSLDSNSFKAITKKCTGLKDLIGFDYYLHRIRLFDAKAGVAILRTLNEFWDVLDTDAEGSPRISSYFSKEDTARLKKAFITVGYFLMKFMSKDNRTDADEIFNGVSDESMVLIGTAAQVGSKLIQAHMPSVALAWLRAYDDLYQGTEDYFDGQYKVTAIFYNDRGEQVYANFYETPGEKVTFNTGAPFGLELEKWEELQNADAHALDGLPEDFSYDGKTGIVTFTMPENSVHIRAIYKQMEFYDNLDLTITNDSSLDIKDQKMVDFYKLTQKDGGAEEGGVDESLVYTVIDICEVKIDGKKEEAFKCSLPLRDYLDRFMGGTHITINGQELISLEDVTSKEDIAHAGYIDKSGGSFYDQVLVFYLPAPVMKVTDVEVVKIKVPLGTSLKDVFARIPSEVNVYTSNGTKKRTVEWNPSPWYEEEIVGEYAIVGTYDSTGLDVSDYFMGDTARVEVTVYDPEAITYPSVTVEDWTYGEDSKEPVITNNKSDGAITILYKKATDPDSEYSEEVPVHAGIYDVKVVIAETETYPKLEAISQFTIKKAILKAEVTNYEGIFDENTHTIDIEVTTKEDPVGPFLLMAVPNPVPKYTVYYGSDGENFNLTKCPEYSEVGNHTVAAKIISEDYEDLIVSGTVKIGEDELDITATAKDITYKDPVNIIFEGKDAEVEKEIWYKPAGAEDSEYTKEEPSELGSYEAKVVISGVEGHKDKELKLSFCIEKRSVLIAVNEYQGKVYGEKDGLIGYTMENVVDDGIDPEIVFEREAGENVGEYAYHFVSCSDEFRKYYEITIGIDSTFLIEPKDIIDTDYEIEYNEETKKATVKIKDVNNAIAGTNRTLVEGEDYDVLVLENYYEEGTVLVVAEGLDNYCNVIEKQYTVEQKDSPDTGDHANTLVWIIAILVLVAILVVAIVMRHKKH